MSCKETNPLEVILSLDNPKIKTVVEGKDKYELQIIYTRVLRKEDGSKKLVTYSFNEKPNKYFYPASTVKLPAAIFALEKLNELAVDGVKKNTHLSIDSVYSGHVSFDEKYKDECGYPTIANYIKKIFLVSDNQSFNRLYDFLGQNEINDRLQNKGFVNSKIIHRLSVARTPQQNKEFNPINFHDEDNNIIYTIPPRVESNDIKLNLTDTKKGKGYYLGGQLINEPKDFSENNFFGLRDQHNFLIRLMMPELFKKVERFNLTEEDYSFLKKYMSMLPKESVCPKYDTSKYYDGYVKFFMYGDTEEKIPENIRIYNKVGDAYGYMIDNAYIIDKKNSVEFFLSAVINVNENEIYNDDNYEYDEVGFPFLAELGRIIYNHELEIRK